MNTHELRELKRDMDSFPSRELAAKVRELVEMYEDMAERADTEFARAEKAEQRWERMERK